MCQITVGLPVYNAERFLADCIQSILNQTYQNFKLLIVDDGSTDSSVEIIKSFDDPRIEFHQDGENKGLPYRLNQITSLTHTKYLARMDADDIMHHNRIKHQLTILEENPEIDLLGSNAYSINEFNEIKGSRFKMNSSSSLIDVSSFIHPSVTGKKQWFTANPYNIRLSRSQDIELWNRTERISVFKATIEPLIFYREFGDKYYRKYYHSIYSMAIIVSLDFFTNSRSAIKFFFSNLCKATLATLVYYFASKLKLEQKLLERRNKKLDEKQVSNANAALAFSTGKCSTKNV